MMQSKGFTILVATADEAARAALAPAFELSRLDVSPSYVADGESAVASLATGKWGCAIVDAALLGRDAIEVVRELRANRVKTPVVLLIEAIDDAAVTALLEAGVSEYFETSKLAHDRVARALAGAVRVCWAEHQTEFLARKVIRHEVYDQLTGLAGRALFLDRFEQMIAMARRDGRALALMIMDINRFGAVNKALGHRVGDRLLQEVAARLRAVARESDTLARMGGDEFACLLSGTMPAGAVITAERIANAMARSFVIEGHRLALGISIGISLYPAHGEDGAVMMRQAEAAVVQAKRDNSGFAIFSGKDDGEGADRIAMAGDLRAAIEHDELAIHYQPKVSFETGSLCGAEALLRWESTRHGMVPPDTFIPLAEETGLMNPLTRWVLNGALSQQSRWRAEGLVVPVSVNLSPTTLHNSGFPDQVGALLRKWGIPANHLVFEITESSIMSDVARATETVSCLNEMGVRISIDDFGTGYTSLAYIRKLPVSEIKVDKSFVLNMRESKDDAVIVRSVVDLGHNLGLEVVAEGIEDVETWDMLARLGCTTAQGYYICRPVEPAAMAEWARGHSATAAEPVRLRAEA